MNEQEELETTLRVKFDMGLQSEFRVLVNQLHLVTVLSSDTTKWERFHQLLGYFQPKYQTDQWESPSVDRDDVEAFLEEYLMELTYCQLCEKDLKVKAIREVQERLWEYLSLDEAWHNLDAFNDLVALYVEQADFDLMVGAQKTEHVYTYRPSWY